MISVHGATIADIWIYKWHTEEYWITNALRFLAVVPVHLYLNSLHVFMRDSICHSLCVCVSLEALSHPHSTFSCCISITPPSPSHDLCLLQHSHLSANRLAPSDTLQPWPLTSIRGQHHDWDFINPPALFHKEVCHSQLGMKNWKIHCFSKSDVAKMVWKALKERKRILFDVELNKK